MTGCGVEDSLALGRGMAGAEGVPSAEVTAGLGAGMAVGAEEARMGLAGVLFFSSGMDGGKAVLPLSEMVSGEKTRLVVEVRSRSSGDK